MIFSGKIRRHRNTGRPAMQRPLALAVLTAIALMLSAAHSGAAELRVLSARAVQEPLQQLAAAFAKETGHRVDASYDSPSVIQSKLKAGEKPDLMVLPTAAMDQLDKAGLIVSASRAELARAVVGMAVKSDTKEPDISTPNALKATLLAVHKIAYTDPAAGSTVGTYATGLLMRLGIAAEKALLETDGTAVAAAVADGKAGIGMTFISELLPNKGVKVVGPIPQAIGLAVGYEAAVPTWSKEGDAARALIGYLTSPAARDHFKQAGL
jgi:molybdate transport system substrate-binding protein